MSILRFDPTTNDWVIFAPSRARRPHELRQGARPDKPTSLGDTTSESVPTCPFCPDNERYTPTEIFSVRDFPQGPWKIRVVPNKFPALRIEEGNDSVEEAHRFFRHRGGCGAHEVIIETPRHDVFLGHQPVEQVELLLQTMQSRFNDLLRDSRFQTIVLFKNHGEAAGTSLQHPHCQLIATPVVPRLMRLKLAVATDYFDMTGHCLYCMLRDEELSTERRVLVSNNDFVAILPYASHSPFETWILPRHHQSSFGDLDGWRFRPLAELLRIVLLKLYVGLENPAFNLTINSVPRGDEDKTYFLWHIEITPRLSTPAGFELGSGMSINTVLPEEAAEFLRDVDVSG